MKAQKKGKETFTLEEVEKLVKNAYEVGLCDGIECANEGEREYSSTDEFWLKNINNRKTKEIVYIV